MKWGSAKECTANGSSVVGKKTPENQCTVKERLQTLKTSEGWPGCKVGIDFDL